MLSDQIKLALEKRRCLGTLRHLTNLPSRPDVGDLPSTSSSTAKLIDLSSNDYLSLATDSHVREDFMERLRGTSTADWSMGSTGSRLLDGQSSLHNDVESVLSSIFRSPSALLFNSGYDANVSIFSFLPQPGDVILYDEYVHASVHDGMRGSRTSLALPFRHNDVQDLARCLADLLTPQAADEEGWRRAARIQDGTCNVFVAVEAVYSMDGDICPLRDVLDVVEAVIPHADARHVIVDEAHSTGLYGPQGSGLCVRLGVQDRVAARLITFGKGPGTSGSAVLCDSLVRHYLINYARPLVYSTSMSHPVLQSILSSIASFSSSRGDELRLRLFRLTSLALSLLSDLPAKDLSTLQPSSELVSLPCSVLRRSQLPPSPIIPLLTTRARDLALHLRSHGFLVRPIAYPTVPRGQERVRVCIHARNNEDDVRRFVQVVKQWAHDQARHDQTDTEDSQARSRL